MGPYLLGKQHVVDDVMKPWETSIMLNSIF